MGRGSIDVSWRIGGPQGRGVDTAAVMFARACAAGGLEVYGRREYYSNIMGRHSYYDVRVSDQPLVSYRNDIDIAAALEEETLARHALAVKSGGVLIYDAGKADVELDRIVYLDAPVKERLRAYLEERDLPVSTAGLLSDAEARGVITVPLPFLDLTARLRSEMGLSQAVAERMLNVVCVGVSFAILDYPQEYLRSALIKTFSERSRLVDMNMQAVQIAYEFTGQHLDTSQFALKLKPSGNAGAQRPRIFVSGSQAAAMGKLAGGISFQTYYPISPATDESVYLEAHELVPTRDGSEASVVVIQTEDELAAVTMATGAALTGARSATATSGPGFSLMAEGLGWAGINEVPLVVTLYQRGGPSTGLPTRTEQGDLRFALSPGHGEFPHMVIASGDVNDIFYDAAQAPSYAEKFQIVVIHMLDKTLASTTQTLPPFDVDKVRIERGELLPDDWSGERDPLGFKRFAATPTGISPRPRMGQPGGNHWLTGAEHTQFGRVTEDPTERERQMEKRARKLELILEQLPQEEKFQIYGSPSADFTVVTWGSNKGAVREALELLKADGIEARLIQMRLLWPFPADDLAAVLSNAKPLVVVEANYSGQLAHLMREQLVRGYDYLVVKYNGRPMAGNELYFTLKEIHAGRSERRVVLRNPFE